MTRVKPWMLAALVAGARAGAAACGQNDGSIVAWGDNRSGQCNVPPPNSGFVAVAAGGYHSLGLKPDGSIVAWGNNYDGQCNVPPPNSGFVAVAAGDRHSLGLKADGSIEAWGDNDIHWRQCNVPPPNTGFVALAADGYHSLGLKADGSIVAWGSNYSDQLNVPPPNTGFVAVAAGGYFACDLWACYAHGHSLGLKADGSIVAWGYNEYGQCNVPPPNSGFVAIAAGQHHSLGLKGDARGDLNCDGALDAFDIEPFTLALFDPAGYQSRYPNCDRMRADINADGNVDAFDIEPFIDLLFGP
jgi:alpha-tubulin suppressor-like RCC1 family protein